MADFCSKSDAGNSNDKKRFLIYSEYAWSFPTLLTIGLLINQHFSGPHDGTSFKVELGEYTCFLGTHPEDNCKIFCVYLNNQVLWFIFINYSRKRLGVFLWAPTDHSVGEFGTFYRHLSQNLQHSAATEDHSECQ